MIADNLQLVLERIAAAAQKSGRPAGAVTLVAVTKGVPPEAVEECFRAGARHFGENRVQEAAVKLPALQAIRAESRWHMIGHLQTNKAVPALGLFDIIQSVDSLRLAETLQNKAISKVPVFLEVNVAGEPSKHGFSPAELPGAFAKLAAYDKLDIRGLMTVAPVAGDPEMARPIFRQLRQLARRLRVEGLSMGMSSDFSVAIEEGATIVRIGTAIFGPRQVGGRLDKV